MMVYLFGGPGDGRKFDAYGNPPEVVFPEEMPVMRFDADAKFATRPPYHFYAQINRSPMYAHDCRGRCAWEDVPSHRIGVEADHEPELAYVELYLRHWASQAKNREE